jgi:hypothetical protein
MTQEEDRKQFMDVVRILAGLEDWQFALVGLTNEDHDAFLERGLFWFTPERLRQLWPLVLERRGQGWFEYGIEDITFHEGPRPR